MMMPRITPPNWSEMLIQSFLRGLKSAFWFTLALVVVIVVMQSQLELTIFAFLLVATVCFTVFYFINSNRVFQDRAFTVAGFCATFFGLAVLAVFFVELLGDVATWVKKTPDLVSKSNARIEQDIEELEDKKANLKANLEEEIRKIDETMAEDLKGLSNQFRRGLRLVDADLRPALLEAKAKLDSATPDRTADRAQAEVALLSAVDKIVDNDVRQTLLEIVKEILGASVRRTDYEARLREDLAGGAVARIDLTLDRLRKSRREVPSSLEVVWEFLMRAPSSEPQNSGIVAALLGSVYLGLITLAFALPVGVGAAIYLEEYKSKSLFAELVQININNLAGIPSVVYGILGGYVFVGIFREIHKSLGWVEARNLLGGGLTLGLLTLPLIIVASQEAIRAVPQSLRQGALALGATKWQVIWTIVLPMSRPGILTGCILAISRAIGEAAPLVLFGALLYVDQVPTLFSRFTVLPMQIFNWSDRPEMEWRYNAAAASLVLMIVLLTLNGVAIYLRNQAQKRMRA